MADRKFNNRLDVNAVEEQKSKNIIYTSGIDNNYVEQIKPHLQTTNAERVINGTSNCLIVLGNDRPAGVASGNGGIGSTGAASIDIIVGLQGPRPIENISGIPVLAQKDFKNDSARIYISQNCNLDDYFNIPSITAAPTNTTQIMLETINNTSGIGLKSDHIRVIARENIKLVTNHAGVNNNCSKGGNDGVYLIAGYDMMQFDKNYQLEPMVRGNKLVEFLEKLLENMQNVQGNVNHFMNLQMSINKSLLEHVHISGAPGSVTDTILGKPFLTDIIEFMRKTIPDSIYNTVKNEMVKQYLQCGSPGYINSRWHKLN